MYPFQTHSLSNIHATLQDEIVSVDCQSDFNGYILGSTGIPVDSEYAYHKPDW